MTDSDFNQLPKGIMRSAVPLHCFFDVVKSQKVAGQQPRQGTKSCRMGRNSVRPSAHPSFDWSSRPLSKGSEGQLEASKGQLKGSLGQLEGLRGSRRGLRDSQRGLRDS